MHTDMDIDIQYHGVNNNNNIYNELYTEDELEVANILLELPDLWVSEKENTSYYNNNNDINHDSKWPTWVRKRSRSVGSGLNSSTSPSPQWVKEQVSELRSPSPSPSPSSPISFTRSREPPHNIASTSNLTKQRQSRIQLEERQTGGIKIEERQGRITMCDVGASTSAQHEHRIPLPGDIVKPKKEPLPFDLNVAWVDEDDDEDEEEEEPAEEVEKISYAQITKLNRLHRMNKLRQKKLP